MEIKQVQYIFSSKGRDEWARGACELLPVIIKGATQ
jgi:hypothetical protein